MNPFLRSALIGLGLTGAGAAGGYYLGNRSGEQEVEEQQDVFNEYNKEENKEIANNAFLSGMEYALGKTSNLKGAKMNQEQFEKIAAEAFNDELNKLGFMQDVKNNLGGGEMFAAALGYDPVVKAIQAKEGKRLSSFGGSMLRGTGYGLLGGVSGATAGAGIGAALGSIKGNPTRGAEIGMALGAKLGAVTGIIHGAARQKIHMKKMNYLDNKKG